MIIHRTVSALVVLSLLAAAGCTSGGGTTCNTAGGLPLADPSNVATAPWPKFRHDNANTGRAGADVDLGGNTGALRWQFPAPGDPAKGAFSSSPVLTALDGVNTRLAIGSNDGNLYVLSAGSGEFLFSYGSLGLSAITSTPAVDSAGNMFFGGSNSTLFVILPDGGFDRSLSIGGAGASSPLIASDGTAIVGSVTSASSGFLPAVCTNDITRWTFSGEPLEASPALGPDGTLSNGRIADCTVGDRTAPHGVVYFASRSASTPYLRAIDRCTGLIEWAFSASAPIVASPVLDIDENNQVRTIYVADTGGRLFAINPDGTLRWTFRSPGNGQPPNNAEILASPALGYFTGDSGTVYLASTDGNLYAVDSTSGTLRAVFSVPTGASIQSSPAVAHDGSLTTVVFGADDGVVYRVVDEGSSFSQRWRFPADTELGSIGRSSPAIGADGTVYVGSDDGHVYAVGSPLS